MALTMESLRQDKPKFPGRHRDRNGWVNLLVHRVVGQEAMNDWIGLHFISFHFDPLIAASAEHNLSGNRQAVGSQ